MQRIVKGLAYRFSSDPAVASRQEVEAFLAVPANPVLVSFPRTGSHWLRMLMERYFERPTLVRKFFYLDRDDYLIYHTHDLELDVKRSNVIYLYRDPVDTVYSQLRYHQEGMEDRDRIAYWSDLYGRHLDKWLHQETFIRQKTVLRYERLKADLPAEFARVCRHLELPFASQRLEEVAAEVSKDAVQEKTAHDSQVINLSQGYASEREQFRAGQGSLVWEGLLAGREHLRRDF
jgi:hypothetical protein